MSKRKLIVIGGGEHARVVMEAARSCPDQWIVLGYCDLKPVPETEQRLDIPWLGNDASALRVHRQEAWFVLGVGCVGVNTGRAEIVTRFAADTRWGTIVHAAATVSPTATVGLGAVVLAGAVVNTGAVLGDHVIVNTGAIIEHDVCLGPFVHIGPAAALGGGAALGRGSYLGLGARVRDHIQVGVNVTVGMGAAVIAPVPDGTTVVGIPAKPLRSGYVDNP